MIVRIRFSYIESSRNMLELNYAPPPKNEISKQTGVIWNSKVKGNIRHQDELELEKRNLLGAMWMPRIHNTVLL